MVVLSMQSLSNNALKWSPLEYPSSLSSPIIPSIPHSTFDDSLVDNVVGFCRIASSRAMSVRSLRLTTVWYISQQGVLAVADLTEKLSIAYIMA